MNRTFLGLLCVMLFAGTASAQYDRTVMADANWVFRNQGAILENNLIARRAGDLSGTTNATTVTGIHGSALPLPGGGDAGKSYEWNGAAWILNTASGSGLTTNDSPVMAGGTLWVFDEATVATDASNGTQIVNWQTMTAQGFVTTTSVNKVVWKGGALWPSSSQYNNSSNWIGGVVPAEGDIAIVDADASSAWPDSGTNNARMTVFINKPISIPNDLGAVVAGDAVFLTDSVNISEVRGNASFYGTSENRTNAVANGIIRGFASFFDASVNNGLVIGPIFEADGDVDVSGLVYVDDATAGREAVNYQSMTGMNYLVTGGVGSWTNLSQYNNDAGFITGFTTLFAGLGTTGLVTSVGGDAGKFLMADGTWDTPSDTGLTTNDSPVMAAGTTWAFALATITNTASSGIEIVNYQTMTGMNYADKDLYNIFSSSNIFNNRVYFGTGGYIYDSLGTMDIMDMNDVLAIRINTATRELTSTGGVTVARFTYDRGLTDGAGNVFLTSLAGDTNIAYLNQYNIFTSSNKIANVTIDGYDIGDAPNSFIRFSTRGELRYGSFNSLQWENGGGYLYGTWTSTNIADAANEIVNYQTMTGQNYLVTGGIGAWTNLNQYNNDAGFVTASITNGFATTNWVIALGYLTTNDSPTMAGGSTWNFDGATVATGASNGTQVVNWQTMTNHVTTTHDLAAVLAAGNDGAGGTITNLNQLSLSGSLNDASGDLILSTGFRVLYDSSTAQSVAFDSRILKNGVWQTEGTASNGLEVVNWQTMTNYVGGAGLPNLASVLGAGNNADGRNITNLVDIVFSSGGSIKSAGGSVVVRDGSDGIAIAITGAGRGLVGTNGATSAYWHNGFLGTSYDATEGEQIVNWQTMTNAIATTSPVPTWDELFDAGTTYSGQRILSGSTVNGSLTFRGGSAGGILQMQGVGNGGGFELILANTNTAIFALATSIGNNGWSFDKSGNVNGFGNTWSNFSFGAGIKYEGNQGWLGSSPTDSFTIFAGDVAGVSDYLSVSAGNSTLVGGTNWLDTVSLRARLGLTTNTDFIVRNDGSYIFNSGVESAALQPNSSNTVSLGRSSHPFKDLYVVSGHVSDDASAGTEIVNYQTLTNHLATTHDLAAVLAAGNDANNLSITNLKSDGGTVFDWGRGSITNDSTFGDVTYIVDSAGKWVMSWAAGARYWMGKDGTPIINSGFGAPPVLLSNDGIWHSEGTAVAGLDIVNYQTMTNWFTATADRGIGGTFSMVGGVTNQVVAYGKTFATAPYPVVTIGSNATFMAVPEVTARTTTNFTFRLRGASSFVTNDWEVVWNANAAP